LDSIAIGIVEARYIFIKTSIGSQFYNFPKIFPLGVFYSAMMGEVQKKLKRKNAVIQWCKGVKVNEQKIRRHFLLKSNNR